MDGRFEAWVVVPHVTLSAEGAAHIQLPPRSSALHRELCQTLPAGTYTLHDGWRDLTVSPAAAHRALSIIHRHYVHADYGGPVGPPSAAPPAARQ
jgi:hypothetical protein